MLHGMGVSTTFGGSVGSDLPQQQCMVASQKVVGQGKMSLNLDCTKEAAQEMAEQGSAVTGGASGAPNDGTLRHTPNPDRRCSGARGAAPGLGLLDQAPQILQRLRHGAADLTRRYPVGYQAEYSARGFVRHPEAHLGPAVGAVP
jgi:hypothetical protein